MEHTYFFQTTVWSASGTYYDAEGRSFLLMGEVQVRRTASEWTLAGTLTVRSDPPVQFSNSYRIARTETPDTLCWESYNPALGTLRGTFEIVGPCIVSIYRSTEDGYSGTETLRQLDGQTYENVGVSFRNGRRISSWTARIHREEAETIGLPMD